MWRVKYSKVDWADNNCTSLEVVQWSRERLTERKVVVHYDCHLLEIIYDGHWSDRHNKRIHWKWLPFSTLPFITSADHRVFHFIHYTMKIVNRGSPTILNKQDNRVHKKYCIRQSRKTWSDHCKKSISAKEAQVLERCQGSNKLSVCGTHLGFNLIASLRQERTIPLKLQQLKPITHGDNVETMSTRSRVMRQKSMIPSLPVSYKST